MKTITLRQLRTLKPKLEQLLGETWTVEVRTAKECKEEGLFDPPCAFLRARCVLGELVVDVDGEVELFTLPPRYRCVVPGDQWYEQVVETVRSFLKG